MREGVTYMDFEDCLEKVKYPKKILSKEYLPEGQFPIVSQEEELISGYWDKEADLFNVDKPIIVFGDHTRVLKYIDFSFVMGADGVKLLVPKDDVNAKYLYYFLKWYKIPSLGYSRHYKLLKEIKVPVIPIDEQLLIVSELDRLASIIADKQQQLRELDNLAKALFLQMFGNPLHNDRKWGTVNLGDISLKIANGYNAKLEEGTYKTEGIPYYRCQNIWWNRIDTSDMVYIDSDTNLKMKSSSLLHNDLIISKIGRVYTENSSLGRTAIYEGEDLQANISGNLCFVRLKDVVVPKFVLYILTFEEYRKWAMKNTPGGIDKRAMSVGQISCFPIIQPPIEQQQEFVSKVQVIEEQKELLAQSITELDNLLAQRMELHFA